MGLWSLFNQVFGPFRIGGLNVDPEAKNTSTALSDADLQTIAKTVLDLKKIGRQLAVTFKEEALEKRFKELTEVKQSKPLPATPPKQIKAPPTPTSAAGSKIVVQTTVPKVISSGDGSPPKAEAY